MSPARRLTIAALLLAAAWLGAPNAAAQPTHNGLVPLRPGPFMAGNDGVGGIEWHPRKDIPAPTKGPMKQGGSKHTYDPPPQARSTPPSPISVDPTPDDERPLARSLRPGRDGAHAGPVLAPLAPAGEQRVTALELRGAAPDAPAFLVVGAGWIDLPVRGSAGGRLLPRPDRVVPLGRTNADGELLVELPAGVALDGLVFQVWVRAQGWQASDGLELLAAP